MIKKRKVKSETNAYSDQYEAFWLEYPEKKAKSKAYETWQKLKGINYAILINAIKLQNEAKHFRGKDGVDYIPHPATWLNQKRWEDEIKQKQINKVIII